MKFVFSILILFLCASCVNNNEVEKEALMKAIDTYETAWANGDFLTVESFFTEDAKRLHTEPHVWERTEIKRYFEEKAAIQKNVQKPEKHNNWKEGNIAYDIFTTDRFKAVHIWEKQENGAWKIKYDIGMLNYSKELPMPK